MCPPVLDGKGFLKQTIAGIFPSLFLKENEIPLLTPPLDVFIRVLRETGYMHLQATKPDTIGNICFHYHFAIYYLIAKFMHVWMLVTHTVYS